MSEQSAAQGDRSTPDERERAADAESYGGQPIDDQELAQVWTDGGAEEAAVTKSGEPTDEPAEGK